jgi:hypothetical protein
MSNKHQMVENNYKQAARLIQAAEAISQLPVRVSWDDTLQVGAKLHLSEIEWAKQLRISVNPKRQDIPYLVASQCAVAIRFFQQQEEKQLVSVKGSREKTVNEYIELGSSQGEAEIMAQKTLSGIGDQLRGMPSQIVVTTWLYRDYPELRENQLLHCTREVETSYASLTMLPSKFPQWLLTSHQAMNGAFALATDYLLGRNDLFEPFKNKGFETICTGLLGDVIASKPETPDTDLVTSWLKRLELTDRFEWTAI